MSDKETAPRICVVCGKECHHEGRKCSCIAAKCTAPARQPDSEKIRVLLIRAVMEMSYMHCAEVLSLVRSSEGESIIEEGMKLLGLKDLSEEELARVRAATPQATPWKSHFTDSDITGDIHNYVDTGDGKRLWAQDADEIVKRHNESTSEPASPTPEKCPSCKSPMRDFLMKKYADPANLTMCEHPWHSSAATQKGNHSWPVAAFLLEIAPLILIPVLIWACGAYLVLHFGKFW